MFTLPASSTRKRVQTGNVHEGSFNIKENLLCLSEPTNKIILPRVAIQGAMLPYGFAYPLDNH